MTPQPIIEKTIGRPYTPPKLTPPKFDILPQPPVKFGQLGTILNKLRNGK